MAEVCYKYTWLENDLRRQIVSGLLPENKPIWSENVLSKNYELSRNTVRHAIGNLIREGLLKRIPGSGTYVVPRLQRRLRRCSGRRKAKTVVYLTFPPYSEKTYQNGSEEYFEVLNFLLKSRGYDFVTEHIGTEAGPPESLCGDAVSSVIFSGEVSPEYFMRHIASHPCVGIDFVNPELPCSWVEIGKYTAGVMSVRHLYRHGHRRIGFLSDECLTWDSRELQKGVQTAMLDLNLEMAPEWSVCWDRSASEGGLNEESFYLPRDYREYLKRVFDASAPPTALVCYDNWRAVCTKLSLESLNIRVPGDVSIISSFRQSEYPFYLQKTRFSSFRLRTRELWQECVRMLIEMIGAPDCVKGKIIRLNPIFIPGETVKTIQNPT